MKQKNSYKFLIGFLIAVFVPLSFYMVAKLQKKDRVHLPHYYQAERVETRVEDGKTITDTVFHQLRERRFINQLGDTIYLNKDLQGKILVINFFFTSCAGPCPKLSLSMEHLQKAFRRDRKKETQIGESIQLISITVDPERDSFQLLRAYADQYHADHDRWWFLTGDKSEIYDLARNELGLSTGADEGGAEDFVHSNKIVIIDRERYIRGYYDGTNPEEVGRCSEDISKLYIEKKRKK